MLKIVKTLLTVFAAVLIFSVVAPTTSTQASTITNDSQLVPTVLLSTSNSVLVIEQQNGEITPFGPLKPTLQRFDGGGLGLQKMTQYQSASFATSRGYTGEHQFKDAWLPSGSGSGSLYNMYYSKVNRYVYILDKNNRGVQTLETY